MRNVSWKDIFKIKITLYSGNFEYKFHSYPAKRQLESQILGRRIARIM